MTITPDQLASARAIADAADQHGTLQAADMLALSNAGHIPMDPTLHTTHTIRSAWIAVGLDPDEASEALYAQ